VRKAFFLRGAEVRVEIKQ